MIRFKQGYIIDEVTGKVKDIVVKAAAPNTFRDVLIGGGLVCAGIAYLTVTAFKHGAKTFDDAHFQTLSDLGLVSEYTDTTYLRKK